MYEDALRELFDEYERVHLTIGLIGNILFLSGSIPFLLHSKSIGVRAFVIGSFLMLVDTLGLFWPSTARTDGNFTRERVVDLQRGQVGE